MTEPPKPHRVALVGAGSVGTAVAHLLALRGHTVVGVASRSEQSAERGAERLGAPAMPAAELPDFDVLLLGVPAGELADAVADVVVRPGAKIVHLAGAVGVAPLAHLAAGGTAICALHPVQACPSFEVAVDRLPGSAWGVTASDAEARNWGRSLVADDLGGVPVDVREEDRVAWHAAAVITSNGIAALIAHGESLLSSLGIPDPQTVLGPLAVGTSVNARDGGGGGATLTGPVVRGEAETIRRHLDALAARNEDASNAYRLTTLLIWSAAVGNGRIDAETNMRIARALSEQGDGR